jgi:hypothetical protein
VYHFGTTAGSVAPDGTRIGALSVPPIGCGDTLREQLDEGTPVSLDFWVRNPEPVVMEMVLGVECTGEASHWGVGLSLPVGERIVLPPGGSLSCAGLTLALAPSRPNPLGPRGSRATIAFAIPTEETGARAFPLAYRVAVTVVYEPHWTGRTSRPNSSTAR